MRILLIDDSAADREQFADLLAASEFGGATLDCAADAVTGTGIMSRGEHDIYFVDYRLPGDSGLDLIRSARAGGLDHPIICLTSFEDPKIELEAERAGANDYLPKGEFSPQALGRAIRYTVSNAANLRAAREAERRFRLAQETANIGTWDWDLRTGAMIWSSRQRAMFGLDPAATGPIPEDAWRRVIHPDDYAAAEAAVSVGVAQGTPFETLFRVVLPDPADSSVAASVRWLAGKGAVLRDAAGQGSRVVGVTVDVTDQQQVMADLRDSRNSAVAELYVSEERFQTYFESAVDGLFHARMTPLGAFVYVAINTAALMQTGMTVEAAKGLTPEAVHGAEHGGKITAVLRQVCDTGLPHREEPSFESPAGRLTYDALYLPLRDPDGRIAGVLGSIRDISDHRRLEEMLRHTQKMELFSQLAGGVAHDFNNILQSISGCVELALDQAEPDTSAHQILTIGLRATERGAELTHRLLAYARKQVLMPQSVDMIELLGELETLLTRNWGPTISVQILPGPNVADVYADPGQLRSALLNLAINASHAMSEGGHLTITARDVRKGGANYVAISVGDTGGGMDAATLARAVEPFFTTKGVGGSGLGLSMVQGFAEQSGGSFEIRSAPRHGTVVEICLPTATGRANPDRASPDLA